MKSKIQDIVSDDDVITCSPVYEKTGTLAERLVIRRQPASSNFRFVVCRESVIYNHILKCYAHNGYSKPEFFQTYKVSIEYYWNIHGFLK